MDKRPCFYRRYLGTQPNDHRVGRYSDWMLGTFHAWSQECEEPNTPNPVAIVEDEKTGDILTVSPGLVRFKTPGA